MKVLRWKETLTEAANLSGSHYLEGRETEFIQNIVNEISLQVLNETHINVAKYQVGIEARLRDLHKVLDVDGNDVCMVGIWGTGGIGKTTVAKAVYNSLAHVFERSCFLENVRERSIPYGGLVDLQNLLLYEILRGKEIKVTSADKGISVIKERLSRKKVLVIVDDVDHLDQLNNLVGGCDWFGLGSRIIITTRDKHLLTSHQVSIIYKAKKLDFGESLDLFISWNGGRNKNLDDDYVKAAETVVKHAQGLPLALKVLGSHLCGRSIDEWHDALDGNLHSDIKKNLKISYDALEYSVQEVFLDIACFFKGRKVYNVIPILEGCDLKPKYAIKVLVDKALINIEHGTIGMHDLLEELGRGLVYQESPNEPGERSRLWFHEDVYRVLTEGTGTNNIKGIIAKFPTPDDICLSDDSFSKMKNLRLFINVNARFYGDHVDYLSNELRFLHWPGCPLQTLPSTFNPRKLVELYMPCSRLSQLGEGFKRLQNLTSMNFRSCELLTKTPNISGIPNLQSLNLDYCRSLVEVHPSVGFHDKLVDLSLMCCHNLTLFPIIKSKSLEVLNLQFCRRLGTFPDIGGKMDSLRYMFLHGSGIKELPASIVYLINLELLHLSSCENLTNLPPSIYELEHLNRICLRRSRKLVTFPNKVKSEDYVSTLSELDLTLCDFLVSIPECITKFVNMRYLYLHGCKRLRDIPELPPKIVKLDASDCVSLERFSSLSNILKGKEDSQMIKLVDLCNCQRLCGNLACDLRKKQNILAKEQITIFFDHLLSSQKHGFQVVFQQVLKLSRHCSAVIRM
ncbi:Putative disease resistance TIR-NBS-LRR class protein [Prunus dulcis]|uniref:Disease resistance TIR-NBS-LRR class protein n=1 Tax=Prunus dulcis TaxID=3755 RepID=A0A4Y1S0I3_PRUDU|nr:Putative disease resistance TIR-NBS-LRR class protein [Prunus dulcis]